MRHKIYNPIQSYLGLGITRFKLFLVDMFLLVLSTNVSLAGGNPISQERFLSRGGQAEAAIVVGQESGPFYRWVAGELQRYVRALSGAELPIVTADAPPPQKTLIVLGGSAINPLAAAAEQKQLVRFGGLKPDGFVLRTIELDGRSAVVAGGNDETGTMYAAYELLERLGIVFQLSNDIIPEQKPDLHLPALDVRTEPALKYRGMSCCHGIRWYMGLADFRREIDQLAKLKMNVFLFGWGMGAPYAEFSYGGKKAEIIYPQESGFCAWTWNSGTANSVKVGRECFPPDGYLGPPEFAKVQTQDEAYRTAREFLREIIRYAHQRKVKVWLCIGEMPYVPPNLVTPPSGKPIGSVGEFYCGIAIHPGDPAVLDIYEATVRCMIENYPEADRYWVITGSESRIAADESRTQALIRDYTGLRTLLPKKAPAAMDRDLACVALADKLMCRIKSRYPEAKLGAFLVFRGGQLRALDAVLPKDIYLMNLVNYSIGETAMSDFDKIDGREKIVMPRITDDGCELNIQLNAMMYDHERTITDTVRYDVTGVVGQLNKTRGAEASAQYIAEGAWNPEIQCQPFYQRYLGRLFGADALDTVLKAYLLLEENEKALGWHGRRALFHTFDRRNGNGMGVSLRRVDYKQEPLKIDRPAVEKEIQAAEQERQFWDNRAAHCRQALELFRQARPKVWPGAREELAYVTYKTENFVIVFEGLSATHDAQAAFDKALLTISEGNTGEAAEQLEQCRTALDRAGLLVRQAAEQMIPYAHIPTERHILYLFNDAIPSHEAAQSYLAEIIAFWKTKN